ncbi:capsid assembly protein [Shimia sp.]|uniref:capsid assembly protein n=1 Tax=Shimia sp. TaxID=1954381 RepID=UPI003BAB16E2
MTELNITPETPQETQAHIDAMVAKAEGKQEATPAAAPDGEPQRPDWLPEKFATPEDLAKAYAALETKQGAPKQETAQTPEQTTQEEADQAAADVVSAAGLDMDKLGEKIVNNGDLDASDYEALAKQGITQEMVQAYVAGQAAIGDQLVTDLHNQVGGEENFNEIIGWAAENLSRPEIEAFNNTVDNGSPEAVKMALAGLAARHKSEAGSAPNLLGGQRKGEGGAGDVFRSTAEVTKAMRDPRYATDAAYRADVMAKLDRSSVM